MKRISFFVIGLAIVITMMPKDSFGQQLTKEPTFSTGITTGILADWCQRRDGPEAVGCVAYFEAYTMMSMLFHTFCWTADEHWRLLSLQASIDIFIKYVKDHPDIRESGPEFTISHALVRVFPCEPEIRPR